MRRIFALLLLGTLGCSGSSKDDASGGTSGAAGSGGVGASGGIGGGDASIDSSAGGSGGGGGVPADVTGELLGLEDAPPCIPPTAASSCGTFPQCGCDVGQKCDVANLQNGDALCVDDGTVPNNQACSPLLGKCLKGSACTGGTCSAFCKTKADCPGANRDCLQVKSGNPASPVPGMFTCTAGCDPIAPGLLCGANTTCSFIASGPATDCFSAGSGKGKGACGGGGLCAPGYLCVNTGPTLDCLKWCRISNPNDCLTTEFCQTLQTMPSIGGEQYGVCAPK